MPVKHKCFLSFHKDDQKAVDKFLDDFSGDFITRGVTMDQDIIDSEDTEYVMRKIRERFLKDSTVTIVLVGKCTWARRFVDWEVQASLRNPEKGLPNGLLAIQLWQSYKTLPPRVSENVESGYANFNKYPQSTSDLSRMIESAFNARENSRHLIRNPRDRFKYNRSCP